MADTLPEGTDHILPGAAETARGDTGAMTSTAGDASRTGAATRTEDADAPGDQLKAAAEQLRAGTADLREAARAKADAFRAQAEDKARDYVEQGKERASGALGEFARLIGDNAAQIDDKLGAHYGDYARRAADAVSGAADTLRDKEIDDLVEDARALVRRSPGLAIGAAAAAGFFLARIVKSGSEALGAGAATLDTVDTQIDKVAKAARKPGKGKRDGDSPAA